MSTKSDVIEVLKTDYGYYPNEQLCNYVTEILIDDPEGFESADDYANAVSDWLEYGDPVMIVDYYD